MEFTTVADGLRFPEGPVAMLDGSVIVVEIEAGRITRVRPDGSKETVATPGGGPNGLAIGPDGKLYCCNNGGFTLYRARRLPDPAWPAGRLLVVAASSGSTSRNRRGGGALPGRRPRLHPARPQRHRVRSAWRLLVHRPRQDPRARARCHRHLLRPGGRVQPQGGDLPVREPQRHRPVARTATRSTPPRRSPAACKPSASSRRARWTRAPAPPVPPSRSIVQPGSSGSTRSGVEEGGNICVATIGEAGISVVSPAGELVEFVPTPDIFTTNICWGGRGSADRIHHPYRAAGVWSVVRWPRPGLDARLLTGARGAVNPRA